MIITSAFINSFTYVYVYMGNLLNHKSTIEEYQM